MPKLFMSKNQSSGAFSNIPNYPKCTFNLRINNYTENQQRQPVFQGYCLFSSAETFQYLSERLLLFQRSVNQYSVGIFRQGIQ